jgi:hypothetical protein
LCCNVHYQVLIYRFGKPNEALIVQESKYGNQFGEYFGGSITVGDINGDKLDDLIVGAPFHKAAKYNEGKVYIFLGSRMVNILIRYGSPVDKEFGYKNSKQRFFFTSLYIKG